MLKANYEGETYWEANLLDGHLEADNTFRLSSDGKNFVQAELTANVDITPGHGASGCHRRHQWHGCLRGARQ